jgi:hypothetical protein
LLLAKLDRKSRSVSASSSSQPLFLFFRITINAFEFVLRAVEHLSDEEEVYFFLSASAWLSSPSTARLFSPILILYPVPQHLGHPHPPILLRNHFWGNPMLIRPTRMSPVQEWDGNDVGVSIGGYEWICVWPEGPRNVQEVSRGRPGWWR